MDFTEAARRAGLDPQVAIRNLKRQLRYAMKTVPVRIIPGVPGPANTIPRYAPEERPDQAALGYYTTQQAKADATRIAQSANPAAEYIRLFELRNGLRSTT